MNETTDKMPDDVQAFLAAATSEEAAEAPEHALLKVWLMVLGNVEEALETRLSMAAVNNIVRTWPQIKVQEAMQYHRCYHEQLLKMRSILEAIVATDEECLDRIGEDDVQENRDLYLELLTEWQRQLVRWEVQWDPNDDDAHVVLAASLTVAEFFFGSQGLVHHLDLRGFVLSDAEAEAIWANAQEV